MRDFLHCAGIASGNFKLHKKQDNKSMMIKLGKKNQTNKKNKQRSRVRKRIKKSHLAVWKGLGKALASAAGLVVSVAASAPSLTSFHCAHREFSRG